MIERGLCQNGVQILSMVASHRCQCQALHVLILFQLWIAPVNATVAMRQAAVIGPEQWDMILIFEYPSVQKFVEMATTAFGPGSTLALWFRGSKRNRSSTRSVVHHSFCNFSVAGKS
jgi:hypothetical protein